MPSYCASFPYIQLHQSRNVSLVVNSSSHTSYTFQMMNDAEKEDEKKEEEEKDRMLQELHNLDNVDEGDEQSK